MDGLHILMVGLGGALGAIGRYLTVVAVNNFTSGHFPWGTFVVNIVGSFLLGLAFVFIVERLPAESLFRTLLMVGFLGAFTTFSTFSLEVVTLVEKGNLVDAGAYVLMSVILCVIATSAAVVIGRMLVSS